MATRALSMPPTPICACSWAVLRATPAPTRGHKHHVRPGLVPPPLTLPRGHPSWKPSKKCAYLNILTTHPTARIISLYDNDDAPEEYLHAGARETRSAAVSLVRLSSRESRREGRGGEFISPLRVEPVTAQSDTAARPAPPGSTRVNKVAPRSLFVLVDEEAFFRASLAPLQLTGMQLGGASLARLYTIFRRNPF